MCYGDRNCAVRRMVKEDGLTVVEAQASIDRAIDAIAKGLCNMQEALEMLGFTDEFKGALTDWPD